MCFDEPMPLERGMITEQLTDKEISSLNDSIELFLNDEPGESDYIIANELPRRLWDSVIRYQRMLSNYYEEEDRNAEQDH